MNQPSFQRIQHELAAHLRDPVHAPAPEGIAEDRLRVYRNLLFGNVFSFMCKAFPVTRLCVGDNRFKALVRRWYAEHRASTPLFPYMPGELAQWLEAAAPPDIEPWLPALVHYEWVELALSLDPTEPDLSAIDPEGDLMACRPVLSPLAWPLAYAWPVHRIAPDAIPAEASGHTTTLLVYRDAGGKVRFMETNPVTHRLLIRMREEPSLTGDALIKFVAGALLLQPGREILEHLRETGIVLGTRR